MKIVSAIFLAVLILVVGLSFLSPRSIEEERKGNNFIKKISHEDYRVQYKRRDFISERRLEKHEALKGNNNYKQKAERSRHEDFRVSFNDDSARNLHDDF